MRGLSSAFLAILITSTTLVATGGQASAGTLAGNGYSSSYAGESVFESRAAGETAQNSVIFFNDGTQPWLPGVIGLLVCLPDKVTCNVASPNAAYASGWYSGTVYATVTATVAPGQNGFFVYNFTVPPGTAGNTTVMFNGDVGIIATGAELRPEGYFQQNTTPPILGTLTISPTSASLPVGGQQQFTATTNLTGSIAWSVTGTCGGVTTSGGNFTAVSMTSAAQPCSVVATIGGLTATAQLTVFGQPASLSCAANPAQLVANGGGAPDGVTSISATVKDANGNPVTNSTIGVTATNGSPNVATITSAISASAVNGVATFTVASTLSTGQVAVVLSGATTITTCTAVVPIIAAGVPTQLYATIIPTAIAADGSSNATLRIDVQDAKGDRTLDAGTTVDVVASGSCTLGSVVTGSGNASGSSGTATDSQGRIEITVISTLVAGTCQLGATPRVSTIAASSAVLTTKYAGAPVKLGVTGNDSPHAAGSSSTTNVTVAVLDGAGTQVSRSSLGITANVGGSACTGAGGGDVVISSPGNTSGGQAVFQFTSNGAYAACVVLFTASGVTATQATIAFTPGGADRLGCQFLPTSFTANGASTAAVLVTVQDQHGNTVAAGSYGVGLNRTGGDGVTTVSSAIHQTTVGGIAAFQVRSAGTSPGADVYTPSLLSGTLPHVTPDRTCIISANP